MSGLVPLLQTRSLKMRFGGVVAIDAVDFSLAEMELRCLIGPNGAGKSTFFKMLTGQQKPTSGHIEFRGQSIVGKHAHEIARLGVGIKTQTPNVLNGLSVRENIWFAARRRNTPKGAESAVEEVLHRTRLESIANRVLNELSHGQRQWAEIAMVFAGDPDLILLDEPAAGMTDEETERTAELIHDLNRTRALVVVEHDMKFIKMIAKKVTVFHQGNVLMEDTIESVMSDLRVRDVYLGRALVS